ncbi:hypothetical protein BD309DRAFT_602586 [Dichomitus squalens]|uniref:Uncharacterized protein n=1 Tax=Dichomitus squalens TaxID=114155 RepID=A0A4Q9N355_9APHY|nr:hypothetical protein BD311DRAFT_653334 [Dichomitus squalens]TBU46623.1 hypothetical protein BD309DRAFT_602586 [Dichomitus squalens]TBU58417.1 hypothetical protein BD310DRAFT_819453 [Dichomitus squalens]
MSVTHRARWDLPLDPTMYAPDEEEKTFMKATTGIQDDEELKEHIFAIQAKAFTIYKYPCIRQFNFMRLKIARMPAYPQFLELGRQRKDAIFLDVGCGFGNDTRKAIIDGWPIERVIVADLSPEMWNIGHELFRSTPETFPVPFLQGDILDPAYLAPAPILPTSSTPILEPLPPIGEMKALTELHGKISAVFASAFFHLFEFEAQQQVARKLAGLLSPLPGSMIFGSHTGMAEKERWDEGGTWTDCHSPESWTELWEGIFAEAGARVEVKTRLRPHRGGRTFYGIYPESTKERFYLDWSVTRV